MASAFHLSAISGRLTYRGVQVCFRLSSHCYAYLGNPILFIRDSIHKLKHFALLKGNHRQADFGLNADLLDGFRYSLVKMSTCQSIGQ